IAFRTWELFVLSVVLQIGMLPMMAADFHRITLAGPIANLIAVPLTGVIVPLGFVALFSALVLVKFGLLIGVPLGWLTSALLYFVHWFADFSRWSCRIPGPPVWLLAAFFAVAVLLAASFRFESRSARRIGVVSATALAFGVALIAIYPFTPNWHR